ncbi:hypothetical protein D3C75_882730 [compost metagenome]
MIAVRPYVGRMGYICPKNRTGNGNPAGVSLVIAARGIDGDTIIRGAEKYTVDLHIRAGHHINAVRPAAGTEGFDIPDVNSL